VRLLVARSLGALGRRALSFLSRRPHPSYKRAPSVTSFDGPIPKPHPPEARRPDVIVAWRCSRALDPTTAGPVAFVCSIDVRSKAPNACQSSELVREPKTPGSWGTRLYSDGIIREYSGTPDPSRRNPPQHHPQISRAERMIHRTTDSKSCDDVHPDRRRPLQRLDSAWPVGHRHLITDPLYACASALPNPCFSSSCSFATG